MICHRNFLKLLLILDALSPVAYNSLDLADHRSLYLSWGLLPRMLLASEAQPNTMIRCLRQCVLVQPNPTFRAVRFLLALQHVQLSDIHMFFKFDFSLSSR